MAKFVQNPNFDLEKFIKENSPKAINELLSPIKCPICGGTVEIEDIKHISLNDCCHEELFNEILRLSSQIP